MANVQASQLLSDLIDQFDVDPYPLFTGCVCGHPLTKIIAANAYENGSVCCDLCEKESSGQHIIWHCAGEKNASHEHGYDICNECIHSHCDKKKTVIDCPYYHRLIGFISKYNQNISFYHDSSTLRVILDDYLHLLHQHGTDEEFEQIANNLGECKLFKCQMFERNYHRKSEQDNLLDNMDIVLMQIMDKIHCCFQHCYDLGMRFTKKQRQMINDAIKEDKNHEHDCESTKQLFARKHLTKIRQIMSTNKTISASNRYYGKYNQFFSANGEKKKDNDDRKMYNFGMEFAYGYDHEITGMHHIKVFAKYSSLKSELLNNKLCHINMPELNAELTKASLHLNSFYSKKHIQCRWAHEIEFAIDNVLSLMIYCNFDNLQNIFSKTYREQNGAQHGEFYHLGKFLKIAIRAFGSDFHFSDKVFHGISEHMHFPQYFQDVAVYSPLSTTTSFAVASTFTNQSSGLVITFVRYSPIKTSLTLQSSLTPNAVGISSS